MYTKFDFLNFLAYRSNSIERNNRVNEIRIEIVVILYHILDEKILALSSRRNFSYSVKGFFRILKVHQFGDS